jgi:hypothetical protein
MVNEINVYGSILFLILSILPPESNIDPISVIIPHKSVSYKAILMFSVIFGPSKIGFPFALKNKSDLFKINTQIRNNSLKYQETRYFSATPEVLSPLMLLNPGRY